jgi:hypothetical protein
MLLAAIMGMVGIVVLIGIAMVLMHFNLHNRPRRRPQK